MAWVCLKNVKQAHIGRGVQFRFPATWPFEDVMEFTTLECSFAESGWAFIASSGYHSCRVELVLPLEAMTTALGSATMIDTQWLIKNWRKWVYDVSPANVMVNLKGRGKPKLPVALK